MENTGNKAVLIRNSITAEGIFGTLAYRGITYVSLENRLLAIPQGSYKLSSYQSPHFGYEVALLNDVPGRSEIEIHRGNYPTDSHGCILIAEKRTGDTIEGSASAFNAFMATFVPGDFITVINSWADDLKLVRV